MWSEVRYLLFFFKRESFDANMAKWYHLLNLNGESMDICHVLLSAFYVFEIYSANIYYFMLNNFPK